MNIVITGASSGIGFELAKRFASIGNHTILALARNEGKLKELKSACIRENIEAHLFPIPFDIAAPEPFGEKLAEKVRQYIPTVDILVNNAGYLVNSPFESLSANDIEAMTSVNFTGPARIIKSLIPLLSTNAHVINISSMGGFQGSVKFSGLSVYSATKAAIASLTECLAEEYKQKGISFNCLALGAVQTEMLAKAFPDFKAPLMPNEMAEFIADFALKGNKFFNGKVIPVSLTTP